MTKMSHQYQVRDLMAMLQHLGPTREVEMGNEDLRRVSWG